MVVACVVACVVVDDHHDHDKAYDVTTRNLVRNTKNPHTNKTRMRAKTHTRRIQCCTINVMIFFYFALMFLGWRLRIYLLCIRMLVLGCVLGANIFNDRNARRDRRELLATTGRA